jgi:hypothetical protein
MTPQAALIKEKQVVCAQIDAWHMYLLPNEGVVGTDWMPRRVPEFNTHAVDLIAGSGGYPYERRIAGVRISTLMCALTCAWISRRSFLPISFESHELCPIRHLRCV